MSREPKTSTSRLSVLLCGDLDPNTLADPADQILALAEALSIAGFPVGVLFRARFDAPDSLHLGSRFGSENVRMLEPRSEATRAIAWEEYASEVEKAVADEGYDLIIARGIELNTRLLRRKGLVGRLCAHLPDAPGNATDLTDACRTRIARISAAARICFVETESLRSFIEAAIPAAAGKTALMPPMIPKIAFADIAPDRAVSRRDQPLRLVYSGRFKKEWSSLEMDELTLRASEHGIDLVVTEALDSAGTIDREERLRATSEADCGFAWADLGSDASNCPSPRALEFAAAGSPPVLRRSAPYEDVFGKDYPLFAENADPLPLLLKVVADRSLIDRARIVAQAAARDFSLPVRSAHLGEVLEREFGPCEIFSASERVTRVLIAGYDFKFMDEIIGFLEKDPNIELVFDKWRTMAGRGHVFEESLLRSADVVFAEWCTASAVWYSRHKLPHQKLIVRLHRFEMNRIWPHQIDYDNVDAFIVIAPHMAERMRNETAIDPAKLHVLSNTVDTLDFRRPKIPGAEYRLGLAGIVPVLKRPDRALALMRELKRLDPRFTLHIRGRLPSSYKLYQTDGFFRLYYQDVYRQITRPGDLHGSVVQEPFGPDMANWFRRIGWILSPSVIEGSHVAVAEGMASGAVPVLWNWPGAGGVYPAEQVFEEHPERIAQYIHRTVENGAWEAASTAAREFIGRYDTEEIQSRWIDLFRAI